VNILQAMSDPKLFNPLVGGPSLPAGTMENKAKSTN
jgi:hypothetical protein